MINLTRLILIFLFFSSTIAGYSGYSSYSGSQSSKSNQPLAFNLKACSLEVNRDWTKINVAVSGGLAPYAYYFDQYPQGWRYIKQDIYVPKQSMQKNQKYPCKVRIVDKNKNQARGTIVFLILAGKVSVSQTLYPYDKKFDDKFFNADKYSGRPKMINSGSYYDDNNLGNNKLDMTAYDNYVSNQDLQYYKDKTNQLSSKSISNSYGTGLIQIDIKNGFTDKGTFSLVKALNPSKNQNISNDLNNQSINKNTTSTSSSSSQTTNKQSYDSFGNAYSSFFGGIYGSIFGGSSKNNTKNSSSNNNSSSTNNSNSSNGNIVINSTNTSVISGTVNSKVTDNVFIKLLTTQQIDDMILSADGAAFTKLIQDVNKSSTYTCEQKVSYLNNMLGRVQSAISMKSFAADQLQSLVDSANDNINTLTVQINQKKQQIKTLNITTLKQKIQIDLTTLQGLYSQYNSFDLNTSTLQANINNYAAEIAILRAKSDIDRQQLIRQKLSYNQADLFVKKIQKQLNDTRAKKNQLDTNIIKYQGTVTDAQLQINATQANITNLQAQINKLYNESDSLKIKYQDLQSAVQRYRSDISKGSAREDQYLIQISTMEQRLKIQKSKLATQQLSKLQDIVTTLSQTLPNIQSFIDENYYKCYNTGGITSDNSTSISVYVVSLPDFQSYIETSYQLKPDWSKVPIISQSIRLTSINLMDSSWQSAYGQPYDIISFANTKDFSFQSDFTCLNPANLQSGFGVITNITSKSITIDNQQGASNVLNLATCSRMETTQFLPSIGQKIYWRGNAGTKTGQFNVYRASCI